MSHALVLEPSGAPEPGRPVALSARVARATAPNPGMMTGPGTNTYLVGTTELAVVDPGPDDAGHLDALAELGAGRIRWIVVTHTHPDHAPGAAGLAARTGAEVLGFCARDDFVPTREVGEGYELRGGGLRPARPAHPGPRLEPPLLAARRRGHALLRRPRHVGIDRGHRAA
jgi:glyoxylase-like metal-dependent hydrolase (beta-lactamase superfamily II)